MCARGLRCQIGISKLSFVETVFLVSGDVKEKALTPVRARINGAQFEPTGANLISFKAALRP
jgi:hypothetical protein